eukprot:TRINITY_DN12182_c0_g2_i12.p1 TRINITY_DN12182_c0_g2~~TRINITY_DN12182_c0_g2_i12.p1  ORF type:complete len:657 (+),score=126.19 TRINITY_DN12182_c0_g2_i12:35-2005(+)
MGRPLSSILASNGKYVVFLYAAVTVMFMMYLHQHSQHGSAFLPGTEHHSHLGRKEQHLEIPKIIHQTWKTTEIPATCTSAVASWKAKNPGFEYRFYTDADMDAIIKRDHAELWGMYQRMVPVMKADLFRYLILYDVGGYYADIDVECLQPIETWQTRSRTFFNVGMMVGFEVITGTRPDWRKWFARKFQMCQWTIASVPEHPILGRVIDHIWNVFENHTDEQIQTRSAVDLTGPAVWSDAVTDFMKHEFNVTFGQDPFKSNMLRDEFVLVGDVLLLPLRSLAVGSAGYQPPATYDYEDQFVRHGFQGSWKRRPAPAPLPDYSHQWEPESCATSLYGPKLCTKGRVVYAHDLGLLMDGKTDSVFAMYKNFKENTTSAFVTIDAPDLQNFTLQGYELTGVAEDLSRNPRAWVVEGRLRNGNWTLLHAIENAQFPANATRRYTLHGSQLIHQVRFNFTVIQNASDTDAIAMAELKLLGMPKPLPPEPACMQLGDVEVCACCTVEENSLRQKEGPLGLIDGNTGSKWHIQWEPSPFYNMYPYLALKFQRPITVLGYNMTAANDFENRDPSAWHVQGKSSSTSEWVDIDVWHDVVFEERYANKSYTLADPAIVTEIKLQIEALRKPDDLRCRHTFCTQLGEWMLMVAEEDQELVKQLYDRA